MILEIGMSQFLFIPFRFSFALLTGIAVLAGVLSFFPGYGYETFSGILIFSWCVTIGAYTHESALKCEFICKMEMERARVTRELTKQNISGILTSRVPPEYFHKLRAETTSSIIAQSHREAAIIFCHIKTSEPTFFIQDGGIVSEEQIEMKFAALRHVARFFSDHPINCGSLGFHFHTTTLGDEFVGVAPLGNDKHQNNQIVKSVERTANDV